MWDRLWGQYSFHFPPNTNSNSAHTAMNHKTRPGNGRRMSPPPPSAPLAVSPSRCFHLLGFDVMLDRQHKIWLLEVNSTPSFNADSLLDLSIKQTVIERSLEIMHFIKRGVRRRERKGGRRRKGTEGGNVDGDEVEEEEEELSLEMLAMQRKIEQIKRELNQEKNKKKKKKKRKEKKKKKKEKEKEESERDRVGGGTKERKESQDPSQQEVEARPLKDKDAQTKQEVETDGESVGKSQRDGKNMAGEGEVNRSLDSNWSDVSDGPVSPDIEDGGMSRGDGEGGVGGVGGARQGGGVDRKEESSNSDTGKEDNKECDDNDANDAHEVGEVGGDGGVNGRNNSTSASHADTNCFPFPAPLPPSPPSPASDQRPSIDHTGPSTRLALTCACIRDIADRHTKDQKDGDEKEAGEGNEGEGGGAHREEDDVNSDGDENHHRNKINGRNGQGDSDGWNGSDAAQNQNVQGLQGPRGCAEHAPCCEEREKQRAALRACDPLQPRVVQNIQDARDKDSGGAGNHGEGSREEKENIASNNHGDGEAGRQDGLLFLAVATCEDTSRFSASKGSDSYDNNQDLNIGHTNASLANSNAEENGHDDRDKSDKSDGNVGGDDCDDVSAKGCRVDPRTQNSHQHVQDQMQLQHSSSMHKIRSSPLNARKRERTGRDSRERRGGGAQRIHSSSRGSMRGSGGHGLRSVRPQSTEKAGEGSEKRKDGKRKTGKKIRKGGHQVRYIESLKSGVLQRAGILAQVQRLHELQQERRMWNSVVTNASKHGQKRRQRQRLAEKQRQKQNMKQSMKVKQGKKKGKEREEENGKEEGSNTQRMKDKSMQTNQINNTFKKQGENLKNIELGLKQQRGGSHGAHAHHITGYSTSNTNTDKENLHHDHHHKHYYGDGHNNHIRTHEQRAHETGVGKLLAGEKERRGMSIKDQTKGKKGTQRDVCTDNLSNETNMSGEASVRTMRRSKSAGHFLPSLAKHRAAEGKKQRKARRGGREEREEREAPKQVNTLIGSIHPRQYQGEGVTTKEETQRQRHTGSAWEGSEKAGRPLSLSSLSSSAFNKPMTLAHSTSSSSSPSSSLGLSFLARAKATSAGAVQRRRLERLQMQDRDYLYEERRLLAQVHSRNKNNSKDSNRVTTVNTMNTSNTRTAGYFAHPINGSEVSSGSDSGSDHDNNNKNSDSETGTDTNSDIDGESEGRLSQSLALSDEAIKRRAWLRAKREKVMRRKKSQQRKIRRQERQTSGYSSYTSYSIATNAVSLVNSSVTGKRNRKKWSRGERKKHAHIQMKMQDMVVSPLNPALSHSQLFVFGGNQYLPFLYAQVYRLITCRYARIQTHSRIFIPSFKYPLIHTCMHSHTPMLTPPRHVAGDTARV